MNKFKDGSNRRGEKETAVLPAGAGRQRYPRGDLRIRAVRRIEPDLQRLAQALIEIAISQAEVMVDEPAGRADVSTKAAS